MLVEAVILLVLVLKSTSTGGCQKLCCVAILLREPSLLREEGSMLRLETNNAKAFT